MSPIPLGILAVSSPTPVVGVAGYVAGGRINDGSVISTVDKFAFPDDTRTTLATGISSARAGQSGFSNPDVAGYVAGGATPPTGTVSTVDKFAFPDDTRTTLATGLSRVENYRAGSFADPEVAGYVAGGYTTATVDKFAFPSDSRTTLATGLSVSRGGVSSFANYAVAGYVAGGNVSGTEFTTVDKFAFPSDSRTTLGTGLTVATSTASSMLHQEVAGYLAGGEGSAGASTSVNTVLKIAFATDTTSTLGATLAVDRRFIKGFSNPPTAGYTAGGTSDSVGSIINSVEKFDWPSETQSTLAATLSNAVNDFAGFQNA